MTIRVQTEDFDVSHEMLALRQKNPKVGAVASFVGVVRDLNDGDEISFDNIKTKISINKI